MTTVTEFAPFFGSVGGGFVARALVGYAIKKVLKIAAVIVGLFIAAGRICNIKGLSMLTGLNFRRALRVDLQQSQIRL